MPQEFLSTKCPGTGGQIKRRYADFVVEEMRKDGRVCRAKRFVRGGEHREEAVKVPENREGKEQLHLDLEKVNKDLNFSIRKIARWMQCSRKRVGYAGLKDKRAVTCQRISIYKPSAERVEAFHSRGLQLRDAEWSSERIRLGMLKGNRFTVTIRGIGLERGEVGKRIRKCFKEMEGGIANYFGEQRFGGVRQVTHLVGKAFVEGDLEKGVMLYLTHSSEKEEEGVKKARKQLAESRDFSEASRLFPLKYGYERAMIHHLCRCPKDFAGAISQLPKKMRYLFTHAYQSWLFNKIIDERFRQGLGLKRVKGDIVKEGRVSAPLLGFESKVSGGKAGEIERKVLGEAGISLKQFKVKQMPELSSKGARKSIVLFPKKMRLVSVEGDEFFPGKNAATISFELEKGDYATTVLREIMKGASE